MQKLGWMRDICATEEELEGRPASLQFMVEPFCFGGYAVATNGHIIAFVKFEGQPPFEANDKGEAASKKFLEFPAGDRVFPLAPLKDWAARRYDDTTPESSIAHGSAVDRRVMWQALRSIDSETYRLNQVDQQGNPKSMFIFDGDGWRVCVMGLRNTVQTGSLPEFTPAEQPQETVMAG